MMSRCSVSLNLSPDDPHDFPIALPPGAMFV